MQTLVRPFRALRPRPSSAAGVIAPPYDVVDTAEARTLAANRPDSFLHISRPEIDFAAGTDPTSDAVYARGAENLQRLISTGVLEREAADSYYIYRMRMGDHQQTGIALTASVAAYDANRIRRHELTRPDKETDRVNNMIALNAQTGPVLSVYRANETIDSLLATHSSGSPDLEAEGQHAVIHSLWRVSAADAVAALSHALNALDGLYIADGHHRSAAASRVAAQRRQAGGAATASHEYFLSVAFADNQMKIFDYNRVVRDLNGLGNDDFIANVASRFSLTASAQAPKPSQPCSFAMYLDHRWYQLVARPEESTEDPVARLDISVLTSQLLTPVLGIGDPRTDPRIDFVGGVRGLEELERRVDSGKATVAFAIYPTSMQQLMAVADAKMLMPPKSTWFEPKLADGLLTHVLD